MTQDLLAKSSGESLLAHTRLCAEAVRSIVDRLPFPSEERSAVLADALPAAVLHDSGKAATGFQAMLHKLKRDWGGRRHEILSAALASAIANVPEESIFAVLTHHRALPGDHVFAGSGCLPEEQLPGGPGTSPVWQEMKSEWLQNGSSALEFLSTAWADAGLGVFPVPCVPVDELRLNPSWLRRGPYGQKKHIPVAARLRASLLRGILISADHLASAHVSAASVPRFDNYRLRADSRPFQQEAAERIGSAVLRAPTGSGKTDAAFAWMARNQRPSGRLFYVLPYTASVDAMHRRLSAAFGCEHVGLLHSRATASLYHFSEGDDSLSKLDRQNIASSLHSLAREIWFPVRVCTPHQLLRWLLRGRGWETMLAEFPNACFVFDEIHAYEPRIVGLLLASVRLLQRWDARFLFISATMPSFLVQLIDRAVPGAAPIALDLDKDGDRVVLERKRHVLAFEMGNVMGNLTSIHGAIASGGTTLVVCNHVATAQKIATALRARWESEGVVLLHSRFHREDRLRIERKLLTHVPRVLVATQVVEVSLDIDFDRAFLEPAPVDALIQRMGRVNRNRGDDVPPAAITIFTEQYGSPNIYCCCEGSVHRASCLVQRSLRELTALPNPLSERDLVDAADAIYGAGYTNAAKQEFDWGYTHPELTRFEESTLAGAHRNWVDDLLDASAATIDVLPACIEPEYRRRADAGLWIEAESLLVPVRAGSLRARGLRPANGDDFCVLDRPYTPGLGLQLDS